MAEKITYHPSMEDISRLFGVKAKSGIHIDPKNKGKFNATKKKTGKSTEQLTHSSNPVTKKRAIFAQNASKWHHALDGAELNEPQFARPTSKLEDILGPQREINIAQSAGIEGGIPSAGGQGDNLNQNGVPGKTTPDGRKLFSGIMEGAMFGLAGIDALIPYGNKRKQYVVQPTQGVNPHPYGTGSDALMEYGGQLNPGGYREMPKRFGYFDDDASNKIVLNLGGDMAGNKVVLAQGGMMPWTAGQMASRGPSSAYAPSTLKKGKGKKYDSGGPVTLPPVEGATGNGTGYKGVGDDRKKIDLNEMLSYNIAGSTKDPTESANYRRAFLDVATHQLGPDRAHKLYNDAAVFNSRDDLKGLSPEQRISKYYNINSSDPDVQNYKQQYRGLTDPVSIYRTSPDINLQSQQQSVAKMDSGGSMGGGSMQFHYGGGAAPISLNPYSGPTYEFKGPSHEDGGIGMSYGNQKVEVEGGETGYVDKEGDMNVMGNMTIPGTKMKFKQASKKIAKEENTANRKLSVGEKLMNENDPNGAFEYLNFNSGRASIIGADMRMKQATAAKEQLADIQNTILSTADNLNIDPQKLSQGIHSPIKGDNGKADNGKDLKPKYNMPSAYMFDQMHPQFNPTQQDSTQYKNLFDKVVKNPKLYNPKNFNQQEINDYTIPSQLPSDQARQNYLSDAINAAAVRDAHSQLKFDDGGEVDGPGPGWITGLASKRGSNTGPSPKRPGVAERHNNPGNIKYNPNLQWMKDLGAVQGDKSPEGGYFAKFPTPEAGASAIPKLLSSPSYRNLTVDDALKRWTGGHTYSIPLGELRGKTVSDVLADPALSKQLTDLIPQGEDDHYAKKIGITSQGTTPNINVPDLAANATGIKLNDSIPQPVGPEFDQVQGNDLQDTTSNEKDLESSTKYNKLDANQLMGEMYGIATNHVVPVPMQKYQPLLESAYQVSFQDRLNENNRTFSALSHELNYNPNALSILGAQKYNADNAVKSEEFRTNQSINSDINNRNIGRINDANQENLKLADQQMVRQATAVSKTKSQNQEILNSISSKILQNKLENLRARTYEPLFDYRYGHDQNNNLTSLGYQGPDAQFNMGDLPGYTPGGAGQRQSVLTDKDGNIKSVRTSTRPYTDQELKQMELIQKQRKVYQPHQENPFGR